MKISTGEIKKLLKECTANGRDCTPQDFAEYISRNSSKDFTKGQLAGAIAQLADSGDLIKVERGLYRGKKLQDGEQIIGTIGRAAYGSSVFVNEIGDCLKRTTGELQRIVERADIFNMSQNEFMLLGEVKRLKEEIEQISIRCR